MHVRIYNHPARHMNRLRWQQRWRRLFALFLIAGLVQVDAATLRAETEMPTTETGQKSAALQLYTAGVQLAPLLPELLGFTEPQSYLLLLQNNHELRATGGFITAVGRVTVDKGRMT